MPRAITLSLVAFGFVLAHLFVDVQIGLFGPSSDSIGPAQAGLIASVALLHVLWARSLIGTREGRAGPTSAAVTFGAGWAVFINGIAALASAPPPSAGFPYQDVTHLGSLVFGALATRGLLRGLRLSNQSFVWREAALPGAVIVIATVFEAVTALG